MANKPTLDEMRLALDKVLPTHQREANKAKFLEPSKIKDVLYHGSKEPNIVEFKTRKQIADENYPDDPSNDYRDERNAVFLSPDPKFTRHFSVEGYTDTGQAPTTYPVHVQARNPFDFDKPKHRENLWKTYHDIYYNPESELYAHGPHDTASEKTLAETRMKKRIHESHKDENNWPLFENPNVQQAIQDMGHDSFYIRERGTKNLGVYDPSRIKSAIGNRGTYDINDPDINKAKGGKVKGPQPLLPKETVKAYKLFRVDQKQPGKLFPLFVDANTPVEKDKWVEAKVGEMTGNKVKSKIGPLAYRPGWHAGDLPVATHIGEKSDNSLTAPDRRPKNQVWAEVEMPNDVDWQSEANRRGTNKQGKLIPVKAHITDQIPLGGHYRYKTNPNMTGNWLIGGAMKVNRVLPDEEVKKINKKAKVSDLPRSEPINLKDYGFRSGGNVQPLLPKFKE